MPTFDEVYRTLPGTGWLTEREARLLFQSVPKEAVGTEAALEVGCYHGRSTVLLASLFRTVYSVDPMDGFDSDDPTGEKTLAAYTANLTNRSISNVEFSRCRIEDWKPRPILFAHLDGDHTYKGTVAQIEKALACGAKIITIHDVNDTGEGVEIKRAALRLLGRWRSRAQRLAVWTLP